MKHVIAAVSLALASAVSWAATLAPIQMLNPAGSTSGQAILSTGPSTAPAWGNPSVGSLAAIAGNSVLANVTAASASPTAFAMPSCSTSTSALQYMSGTGFTCYANSATTTGTLAQFAATTSAQLAGVISDETGSGTLVFGTSPALAGTPTAPTATVGTNTTQLATTAFVLAQYAAPPAIGATTPAAGTFTALSSTTMSKVFATNTSGQSIPNNTGTTTTNWTVSSQVGSAFVGSTGVYTAPATGWYLLSFQVEYNLTTPPAGTTLLALITVAGTGKANGVTTIGSTSQTKAAAQVTALLNLTSGQTVNFQAYQNSGAGATLDTGAANCYLSIQQMP